MADVRLGVIGAAGRLGARIVQLGLETAGIRVVLAAESTASPRVGHGVPGSKDALAFKSDADLAGCDVLVDASVAAAALAHIQAAAQLGTPLLVATTGLDGAALRALDAAAARIPVCLAPNLSTGVWVLAHLVSQAAATLADYDVEVVETHHRHKKDAPSGTALMLARAAAKARGWDETTALVPARSGDTGARQAQSIGLAALRGGDVVGDHTVMLLSDGERLELGHRASNRDTFARGALRLAPRLVGRAPGRVTVPQLLGLA